jgi:DNA (cytosine-5)-methyltransferase 1
MASLYNENDRYAAGWLRNLAAAGHLAAGIVDERSIVDLDPADLAGFDECHFFAGIGGWPLALRLAGWPTGREIWTGSCPCQPLSSAGQRKGHADERHLWPAFYRLIAECRPATIFGEQVASRLGREWLAGVRADLEHLGYAVGAADLPAACVSAPHIRQRLFWVADATRERERPRIAGRNHRGGIVVAGAATRRHGSDDGPTDGLADTSGTRTGRDLGTQLGEEAGSESARCADGNHERIGVIVGRTTIGLGDAPEPGRSELPRRHGGTSYWKAQEPRRPGDAWSGAEWLPCLDDKARRVEPSIFPLAHGIPGRVGRLRAYGNAIVPQVAAEFIKAFIEVENSAARPTAPLDGGNDAARGKRQAADWGNTDIGKPISLDGEEAPSCSRHARTMAGETGHENVQKGRICGA